MGKRTNPNRIPVSPNSVDTQGIVRKATSWGLLRSCYCLLGAIIDFPDTTQESLIRLWRDANDNGHSRDNDTLMQNYSEFERLVGLETFAIPNPNKIRTEADKRSFIKKVNERALRAGFSLLTRPLVFAGYSEEYLKHLMKKAYCLNHFIDNGEMTVAEINDTLRDEFALEIATVDGVVHLYQFEKENSND